MRRGDDGAMVPEVAAALLAMDATLAGEPTDPDYAGLAELALILRADRPVPGDRFASALDERVEHRFARPARPAGGRAPRLRGWLYRSAAGLAAAVAAVVLVIVVAGHGGGSNTASDVARAVSSSSAAASAPPQSTRAANSAAAAGSVASSSSASLAPAPVPVPSGKRQIVQSAQLQLSTSLARIDDVAQQVFQVVASVDGIVQNSNVTATQSADGNASFQLSVPSANLTQTLNALSSLHGANVVSRSDATTDITGQVGGAGQRLAEARALRRSLLEQLAAATTTIQVDSIKIQLRDVDASIASDLATLRKLQHQVAYSQVAVTIQATGAAGVSHGSSFTLGRAVHDAGRVLVVIAGGALIALAVLVPVGLLTGLLAWAGLAIRRHRREQVLDLV
jgi:hypothetical protein